MLGGGPTQRAAAAEGRGGMKEGLVLSSERSTVAVLPSGGGKSSPMEGQP